MPPSPIPFVPSTVAPTHPGRFRVDTPAPGAIAERLTGEWLPELFGGVGRQSLKVAWGADPDGDPSLWTWTDLVPTGHVQWNPGVAVQIAEQGTSASQIVASQLTADLRNDQANGGDYTLGNALGANWPNVRENTPIKRELDAGGGPVVRFQGYVTSWDPSRGPGGERFVSITAHGASRRIRRGKSAKFSALHRVYDRLNASAYWSLEEGEGGTVGASSVMGVPDMTTTLGTVSFGAADASLPSSLALAQFSRDGVAGQLTGVIPATASAFAGDWTIEFVFKSPALDAGKFIIVMHWNVTGTIDLWDIVITPIADGGLTLRYINTAGGLATYKSNVAVDDGEWHQVRVNCQQTAGIDVQLILDDVQIDSRTTTGTNGAITTVVVNPTGDPDSAIPALGHIAVFNDPDTRAAGDSGAAFRGYSGETVAERMARLAAEAGVILEIIGDADDLMGPQRPGTFLELLQDAVDVDGGILFDGLGPGLTYITRQHAYSQPAQLTLDAAQGDYVAKLRGSNDDSGRVNTFNARDPLTNATRTFTRTDGELGTDAVGEYEDGGDFRVENPEQLTQIAAWRVGLGTVPGLRWTQLSLQLAKPSSSRLAQQWLDALPLSRVDALGIDTGSNPDRRLILRGWRETTNSLLWTIAANIAPYDAFAVSVIANETGDTSEFIGWAEVDTVTTAADLAAGGSSVVVDVVGTTLTNPTVSTYADDLLGLYIWLDGLKVGVTAISAPSGTQQTLTLNPADVVRRVPAGSTVMAWNPFVAGL